MTHYYSSGGRLLWPPVVSKLDLAGEGKSA